MLNSPQTSANAGYAVAGSTLNPIKNPKRANVQEVSNGYLVSLSKVNTYGEDYAVASTVEEVNSIINGYFN